MCESNQVTDQNMTKEIYGPHVSHVGMGKSSTSQMAFIRICNYVAIIPLFGFNLTIHV